jgi:hypothetical protein
LEAAEKHIMKREKPNIGKGDGKRKQDLQELKNVKRRG